MYLNIVHFRALYFDADIYLLDDPLSAVDTAVGRLLFEKYIQYKTFLHEKFTYLGLFIQDASCSIYHAKSESWSLINYSI